MKHLKSLSLTACALLMAGTSAFASEIQLVDDFSTSQALLSDQVVDGSGDFSQVGAAGDTSILGGYRDLYIEEVASGLFADSPTSGITAQVSGDRLTVELGSLVKAFAVVTYDGSNEVGSNFAGGVDTGGLGGMDFTGTTDFLFEDIFNDGAAPAVLKIWSDDADNGVYVEHLVDLTSLGTSFADPLNPTLYDRMVGVNNFSDAGSINWAKIGAFQAWFNLDSTQNTGNSILSVDLSLGRIVAVPEPAALSMLGAGMLMLGFVGYRRKNKKQ